MDSICKRIQKMELEKDPYLVAEFKSSYLVLHEQQYYRGQCILLLKEHIRELHEMELKQHRALSDELHRASSAISKAFTPWKINILSLGNQTPHVHWHIIPRYEEDESRLSAPSMEVSGHQISHDEASRLIELINQFL